MVQTCPHCTTRSDDPFEVLDNNFVHEMAACEGCGKSYFFAVIECDHCGHEVSIERGEEFTLGAFRSSGCPNCRQPLALIDDGDPEFI